MASLSTVFVATLLGAPLRDDLISATTYLADKYKVRHLLVL